MITDSRIQRSAFGRAADGRHVTRFALQGSGGIRLDALDYGAIVQSLNVPDRDGHLIDVVLGYEDLADYEHDSAHIGAVVGRCANRIRGGMFALDGVTHRLSTNDGPHHLHGGVRGFGKVHWQASPFESASAIGVVMRYTSADGEEGYPGTLEVRLTYAVTDGSVFSVEYRASCDRPTPVNLSQHSYFNLAGEGSGDVLAHDLLVHADAFTEIDGALLPTGTIRPVEGTPLDFRRPHTIGARLHEDDEQLRLARGYDHNFVLTRAGPRLSPAARVADESSGVVMELFTTEPGMQLYTGNFLDGMIRGKRGHRHGRHAGLCLETQHFPDSPNQPGFPSTILRPEEEYRSRTEFRFGTLGAP